MAADRVYRLTNFKDIEPVLDRFDAVIDSIPIMRRYKRDYVDFICRNYPIGKNGHLDMFIVFPRHVTCHCNFTLENDHIGIFNCAYCRIVFDGFAPMGSFTAFNDKDPACVIDEGGDFAVWLR